MSEESTLGRIPTNTDNEILDVLLFSPDPVLGTSEIANQLNIGRRGTQYRLDKLKEEGQVHGKSIGRKRVWWLPQLTRYHRSQLIPTSQEPLSIGPDYSNVELVEKLDIPERGETRIVRVHTVATILKSILAPDDPIESKLLKAKCEQFLPDSGYDSVESFWNACVRPALSQSDLVAFERSQNGWDGTAMGNFVTATGISEHFWEEWDLAKLRWEKAVFSQLWTQIKGLLTGVDDDFRFIDSPSFQTLGATHPRTSMDFYYEYELHQPVWEGCVGDLHVIVELVLNSEAVGELKNSFDEIQSTVNCDISVERMDIAEARFHEVASFDESQTFLTQFTSGENHKVRNQITDDALFRLTATREINLSYDNLNSSRLNSDLDTRTPSAPIQDSMEFIHNTPVKIINILGPPLRRIGAL